MTPAALIVVAQERGMPLGTAVAAQLLSLHGPKLAEDLVAGAATLIDLASALGQDLEQPQAMQLMEASAGDYDTAAKQLLDAARLRRLRQHVFAIEFTRLEKRLYSSDAKVRHAAFISDLGNRGTLGWRVSMLLLAVEDAGLQDPDASAYREKLARTVEEEIRELYPIRREEEWQVLSDQPSAHTPLLKAAIADERYARELVLGKRPDLAQRIDALRTPRLTRDVRRVVKEMRKRLTRSVDGGWTPNPERYEREVITAARDAALRAA